MVRTSLMRQRLCKCLGSCLVAVTCHLASQGYDALVTILTEGNVFKACLIERGANTIGDIR